MSILDELLALLIGLAFVAGCFFAVSYFDVPARFRPLAYLVLSLAAALQVVGVFVSWWRVVTSEYVLTNERAYASYGLVRYFLAQTTFDKVTDVHVKQSLFGRWGGFGTVEAKTAGSGLEFVGVRDPFGVAKDLETSRVGFIRALVERHAATHPRSKAWASVSAPGAHHGAAPKATAPPLWTGQTAWPAFWVESLPLLFFAGFLGLMGAAFLIADPFFGLLMMLADVAFFGLILAGMIIKQRTTRFEVHTWGVVVRSGWIGRRRVETLFEKITDVTTTQGVFGRLLHYGSLAINTAGAGGAPIVFASVPRPDEVKALIDGARARRRAP